MEDEIERLYDKTYFDRMDALSWKRKVEPSVNMKNNFCNY